MESKVNMKYLSDEFFADHNKEKREWYTKFVNNHYTELKHQIDWRNFISQHNLHIHFWNGMN